MKYVFDNEVVCVSKIRVCCKVSGEYWTSVHKNRPTHGLVVYLQGESVFAFDDGNSYEVKAGQVIYLPKFSNYTSADSEDAVCIAVNFYMADSEKTYPVALINQKYGEKYIKKFNKILNVWNEQTSGYQNGCLSILYDIIFNMQQDTKSEYVSSQQAQTVEKAASYINLNIRDEALTIQRVAEEVNITPEYLRVLFKSIRHMSPKEYVLNKRMELAKRYIESQDIKLSYIPEICGFKDYAYFSRSFKRHFGVSPHSYLKHVQKEKEKKKV